MRDTIEARTKLRGDVGISVNGDIFNEINKVFIPFNSLLNGYICIFQERGNAISVKFKIDITF